MSEAKQANSSEKINAKQRIVSERTKCDERWFFNLFFVYFFSSGLFARQISLSVPWKSFVGKYMQSASHRRIA